MPDLNTDALARAGLVPYITAWSGERPSRTPVVAKSPRSIGYEHERGNDRDARGVLWTRCVRTPGVGEPEFGKVHPYRQRQAMRQLLCQVCGRPADRTEQGHLWLMGWAERPFSGPESTGQPPVCLRCAGSASRVCPHLRRGLLAVRVRQAPVVGVFGLLHTAGRNGPVGVGAAALLYDDPRVRMLQARQLMRELRDAVIVDLDEELATYDR
jgi:hypothetical protein